MILDMNVKPLQILIVEDEISLQIEMEMMLDEMEYDIIAITDNSEEALKIIHSQKPDIIMMDIDIKGELSGIQLGEKIKDLDIAIIYVTSHNTRDMYESAKLSNLAAYMVKPVNKLTLESTLELVEEKFITRLLDQPEATATNPNFKGTLLVKQNKQYYKIILSDVQYVEADGNYVALYIGKKKFLSSKNFTEMEKILPKDTFIKTHRKFLINFNYFISMNAEDNTILMENGNHVYVSRAKKQEVLKMIMLG